nr:restriction endonuclease subunit S [Methanobrevibacter smithii]
MSLEFNYYSLGDLVKIKYGKNQKKIQDDENGKYPIYGTGGLMGYSIDYLYDKPSVLIGRKGSIEKVRYIEEPFWTVDTLFYTEVNDKIVIPKFLYYVMSLINLSRYNEGTSIPSLRTETLNRLDLPIPNLDYQKRVLTVLSNIDKKISLNKKINKNLEDTILKIFDSWFVKFELSNEFSDSKLGLIPKGWKIDYLGSKKSCSIIRSGIDEFDNSKIYVATADVDNSIITSNDTLITMNDKPSRANMQPIAKSIWFAKMIDSRKLIMIDDYCSDLLNNYIFSTGFCGLKCVDKYFYYLWAFLLTDAFDVMKNNFCTGTTMQAINNKDTKLIEFVLPDDNIINQFNVIAKPMFKKIYYNSLEIKKLQKLRDTLLPKLMSGEIDVSKINCDLKIIIRKIYIKSSKLFLWRYLSENQNHIKNTKSNETLLKSRTIHKINKFLARFHARYRHHRQ